MQWEVVTSVKRFQEVVGSWPTDIACDVETGQDTYLMGVSFSNGKSAIYIQVHSYIDGVFRAITSDLVSTLPLLLASKRFIGHNFTYDKTWLKKHWGWDSTWIADTRLMWHLSSAPAGPLPYGLKDAQTDLLGWETANDIEMIEHLKAKGVKLVPKERWGKYYYIADLQVIAKYACLDTLSTALIHAKLTPFFDYHDYWPMLCDIMAYNELLEVNTTLGVRVDVPALQRANKRLIEARDGAMKRVRKLLAAPIADLEAYWAETKALGYKSAHHKERFLASPEKWPKFNWNSDVQKRELFYKILKNPIVYLTDNKLPSTNADSVKQMTGEWVQAYLKYEKNNTLVTNYTSSYLSSIRSGRLHPGFNICGTVSYRLSGFKPYLLNAPFDERLVMKTIVCDPGYIGLHADFKAIEPAMTAHYTEDPSLLKVFKLGLGDIYLDLALVLFPYDKELQNGYNPNIPVTKAIKERFARQRKIAKVIQLAVQYTGTKKTVAKNLTKEGIPTTEEQAADYVRAYWSKFRRVAEFNYQLKEVNRKQKHLRNVIGRIIRVPDPEYKDLSNRFIQSSAHDCLVRWVLIISRLVKERSIIMQPMLIDCHDSTSWQVKKEQLSDAKALFTDALKELNESLGLIVPVEVEMKTFTSFAGLKNDE